MTVGSVRTTVRSDRMTVGSVGTTVGSVRMTVRSGRLTVGSVGVTVGSVEITLRSDRLTVGTVGKTLRSAGGSVSAVGSTLPVVASMKWSLRNAASVGCARL